MGHVNRIQGKTAAVKIDGAFEMVTISKLTRSFLDRGNLGIQSFRYGIGDAMLEIGQHIILARSYTGTSYH